MPTSLFELYNLDINKYDLSGPNVGRNFSIKCRGSDGLGARRAKKALDQLRLSDGTWREMAATSPTGTTVRLYLSEDKSPKQIKVEAGGRKLFRAVQASVPGHQCNLNRREGAVSIWEF